MKITGICHHTTIEKFTNNVKMYYVFSSYKEDICMYVN